MDELSGLRRLEILGLSTDFVMTLTLVCCHPHRGCLEGQVVHEKSAGLVDGNSCY